jgi:hypothetical protein
MDVWGLSPEGLLSDWLLLSVVVVVVGENCCFFRKPGTAPPSNVMAVAL